MNLLLEIKFSFYDKKFNNHQSKRILFLNQNFEVNQNNNMKTKKQPITRLFFQLYYS